MSLRKHSTFIALLFANFCMAQLHELGVFVGMSNYIGDVGTKYYVYPNSPAFGVLYKWNTTTRYSLRAGLNFSTLKGSDLKTDDMNRFKRGYIFKNKIQEVSIGVEINFIDFNLHDEKPDYTPYIFMGVNYFRHELFYFESHTPQKPELSTYGNAFSFAIPLTVGFKMNPNPFLLFGLELGVRYTLTDNLDGSNPVKELADRPELRFGNISNNDWYIFTGLTISFTFGELPCYCK